MDNTEDDDFYSASNWTEYADSSSMLGTTVDPVTEVINQTQTDSRVRSRSRSNHQEIRHMENSRKERRSNDQPGQAGYRQRSRSRSKERQANNRQRSRSRSNERQKNNRQRIRSRSNERRVSNRQRIRSPFNRRNSEYSHQSAPGLRDLKLYDIYQGTVAKVEQYGAFLKLEGVRCRDGLCHLSQYGDVGVLECGEKVHCKVVSISDTPTGQRISLSLCFIDQTNGVDLDPDNLKLSNQTKNQRANGGQSEALPELYSIHKGKVAKVETFGCFIALDGFRKQGLCHFSQLADYKVESIPEFINAGEEVFVKVISLGDEDNVRLSLSMKYCSQHDGRDLDAGHANASMDAVRGKSNPSKRAPIVVGDSLDPMTQFIHIQSKKDPQGYEFILDEVDLPDKTTNPPVHAMGRGRGSTLPSWMTEGGGGPQPVLGEDVEKKFKKGGSSSKKSKKHKDSKKHKKSKKIKKSKKKKGKKGSSESSDGSGDEHSGSDLDWGSAPVR